MLQFERERRYALSAENDWYLIRGFEAAARVIIPTLKQRYWISILSRTGNFIASDNPVTMDGPRGEMAGFKSADVILFPVNRYLLLLSTKLPVECPRVKLQTDREAEYVHDATCHGAGLFSCLRLSGWMKTASARRIGSCSIKLNCVPLRHLNV